MLEKVSCLLLSAAWTFADCMYKNGRPENGNWLGLWTKQKKHNTSQKQQEVFFNCSFEHSKVKQTNGIPILMASEASFPLPPPSPSLGGGGEAGSRRLGLRLHFWYHLLCLGKSAPFKFKPPEATRFASWTFQLYYAYLLSILFVLMVRPS